MNCRVCSFLSEEIKGVRLNNCVKGYTFFFSKQIFLCICAEEGMVKFIFQWEQESAKQVGFFSSQRF